MIAKADINAVFNLLRKDVPNIESMDELMI